MNEVWVLKDDCGHEPYFFADRETPYEYMKKDLLHRIEFLKNKEEKDEYDEQDLQILQEELKTLTEEYNEGDEFAIDGYMYCYCYKVYQKGEMPD